MRSCREKVRQDFKNTIQAKRVYYGASEKAQRTKAFAEKEDRAAPNF